MIVVPGPASKDLGVKVARELGVEAYPVEHRIFPDGESYMRLTGSVEGETVAIIQTTAPDQDRRLMQLFMMVSTAKEFGAERVICVVPYLAYSRQDKRFLEGEAFSLDMIMKILDELGADDLVVVDAHSEPSTRAIEARHGVRVHNVSAMPLLAGYLKKNGFDGAYSLSPDKGAIGLAEAAGGVLGGGSGYFEKERDRRTGEIRMKVKDLDIAGKDAVVFDDIVSSGGTTSRAVAGLRAQGAEKVAAACTHALFMEGAEGKIVDAGADLILISDTVQYGGKVSKVSVAPLIAKTLTAMA
ncbi:MAG TPA: ribose-phosphate diphosphokinase [Patescibacteria group bacterium]|nr:ribose-phosphate diphosphokinase [Patescibacteria group bacterium]